ncbi:ATP-dependent Clp protease proteolytic subunit, partial [Roseateles cavernae]|uniref:ATP-dependent Clp protease proteolytic subunit n=1 Tax=Roseateles cavernae TaxID=3153578 RepID=UPI0032E50A1C
QMMIHDAWTIAAGNADDFEVQVANLRRTSSLMADLYVARTGNTLDQVKAWMKETKWFTGQEALTAGFADSLAANVGAVASASLWLSHMQGRITTQLQTQRADSVEP